MCRFPASIELDLIFPRNGTYAPVSALPVVFAIQNANVAWAFGFEFEWRLNTDTGYFDFGSLIVPVTYSPAPTPAGPFFILNSTDLAEGALGPENPVAHCTLEWQFQFTVTCTESTDYTLLTSGYNTTQGSIGFTVAADGRAPNLLAAGACPMLAGLVGVQANLSGCPHLGDSGHPADPCAITLNPALASSISAQLPAGTTVGLTTETATSNLAETTTSSKVADTTSGQVSETATSSTTDATATGTGTGASSTGATRTGASNTNAIALAVAVAWMVGVGSSILLL